MADVNRASGAVAGTQHLVVAERIRESRNVMSFILRPAQAGAAVPAFRAGQHLPIWLNLDRRKIATYTISSAEHDRSHLRISVKLEPDGLGGSRFLHETAEVGTILKVSPPRGDFVLAPGANPVLLITGGIGVTPAIARLHALTRDAGREVYFIHACNDREEHAFLREVADLTAGNPAVHVHHVYANGTESDLKEGRCQRLGLTDRATLRGLLPLDDYHVYLCGPPGFMTAMTDTLRSLGVAADAIRVELFGGQAAAPAPVPPVAPSAPGHADGPMVTFGKSGKSAAWAPGNTSLLEFAEAQGLQPEFSCRDGICGTCACRLLEGEIDYFNAPLDPPEDGKILICCASPRGRITLDL